MLSQACAAAIIICVCACEWMCVRALFINLLMPGEEFRLHIRTLVS